jgi:hypothetical protein
MRGGKESENKIKIKQILGITHDTPDNDNPKKRNLKDYYEKLLDIYINVWSQLDNQDAKEQLAEEFSYRRGHIAVYRHPGRSFFYSELITDLRLLDVMKETLKRDPELNDFSGKMLIILSRGRIYSCRNFGFVPVYSLGIDKPDRYTLDQILSAYYSKPALMREQNKASEATGSDLEREPPPNGGASRHRSRRANKKSRKVRKSRKSRGGKMEGYWA